jgi:hypothetical protein
MVPLRAFPLACVAIALLYWGLSSDGGIVDCGSSIMSPDDKCINTTRTRGSPSTSSTLSYEEQRERNRKERLIVGGSFGILALLAAGAIITQSRQKSEKMKRVEAPIIDIIWR